MQNGAQCSFYRMERNENLTRPVHRGGLNKPCFWLANCDNIVYVTVCGKIQHVIFCESCL